MTYTVVKFKQVTAHICKKIINKDHIKAVCKIKQPPKKLVSVAPSKRPIINNNKTPKNCRQTERNRNIQTVIVRKTETE